MGKLLAPLFVLVFLAGCGAPRYFTMEVLDETALKSVEAVHSHPIEVDFTRPANWELKDGEWNEMMDHGDQAFARGMLVADKPRMFQVGKDVKPTSGVICDVRVTNVKRGHYTFITWAPAIVDGTVTITDLSGKVIFKGMGQGITPESGGAIQFEKGGDDGRIKGAHYDLGRKLAWTLEYYANQKK